MKMITCVVLAAVMALSGFAGTEPAFKKIRGNPEYQNALAKGAMAQVSLKVVDDEGLPVRCATVHARYDMTTYANESSYLTDERGLCCFTDKTRYCIELDMSKDGYYDSQVRIPLTGFEHAHDVKDGKWQPYPMEKTVALKKIRNPITLFRQAKTLVLHTTNQWVGVDMLVGDFIRPFGRGDVSDFQVKVQWDGLIDLKSMLCTADVQFPGPWAGGYFAAKCSESSFPYEYVANTNAEYQPHIYVQNRKGDFYSSHKPFDKRATFVTRSRCRVDEKGRLVAANYGCIRRLDVTPGDWGNGVNVVLDTVFNLTPNDTNLEDDELYRKYKHLRGR